MIGYTRRRVGDRAELRQLAWRRCREWHLAHGTRPRADWIEKRAAANAMRERERVHVHTSSKRTARNSSEACRRRDRRMLR